MAENLTMKLIGLVTTVLVLGAVYLFIVKPVLDTTNNAFDSVNESVNNAFENSGLEGVDVEDLQNGNFGEVQKQIEQANLGNEQQQTAEKVLACVQRVQPNTTKMQTCTEKFQ